MRNVFVLSVVLSIFASPVFAATIRVPADQPTIQAGINAAVNGDTVLVAPGTYFENIDFIGKAITVKSSGGSKVTIIDGGKVGTVVTFISGESQSAQRRGLPVNPEQHHCGERFRSERIGWGSLHC